jgi:hypothetical protein
MLGENNRGVKDYLNNHLNEISADDQPALIGAVKNNEIKYEAITLTSNILAKKLPEESALKELDKIKDMDVKEQVESNIKGDYSEKRRFQEEKDRKIADEGWAKLDENPTYANIPANVDTHTRMSMKNYVKGITDDREREADGKLKAVQDDRKQAIWNNLFTMSYDNPEEFKKIDLMKFRGDLSNSELKEFMKKQKTFDKPEDFTQLVSNEKKIKQATDELGFKNNDAKAKAFTNYTQSLVTEFEKQHGRKATDGEIQNLIQSVGYKGNHSWGYNSKDKTFDAIGNGLQKENDFIKNVTNDAMYFEKVQGRQPNAKEYDDIIYKRSKMTQKEIRQDNKSRINQAYDKSKEVPALTRFADRTVPALSKEIGANFVVTSRYRAGDPQTHGEGKAADVSMSEHSKEVRLAFFKKTLNNPSVKAIGTSDPMIIAAFKGNPKLKDERSYDAKNGTNHVNHAHVTLDTAADKNTIVMMKAPNGKIYSVPSSRVSEYKKAGGVIVNG